MWLKPLFTGSGWIEAGYADGIFTPGEIDYFWAENDNTSGLFVKHFVSTVPQADFGQYAIIQISNDGPDRTSSSSFTVSIRNQATNFSTSTSNALWNGSGNSADVNLGQELAGTSGAAAGLVFYVNNAYQSASGLWPLETSGGTVISDLPPFAQWVQIPAPGNNGGTFYTECCLPPSTVFPAGIDFGTVPVGTHAQAQVSVTNITQTGTLNVMSITVGGSNAGDFVQTGTTCGNSLAPGLSCTITITFTPTSQGPRNATLTVTDSGGSGSGSDAASLTGTGS